MAVDMMSEAAVSDGRLVRPFTAGAVNGAAYWFAAPDRRRESRKTKAFREWLVSEIDADLGQS